MMDRTATGAEAGPTGASAAKAALEPAEVAAMEEALAEHYGEPVRPVSHYCRGFELYRQALNEMAERDEPGGTHRDESLYRIKDALNILASEPSVRKSNLLWRLLYERQGLRTEMCPQHKGRWSGYGWGHECECQNGPDLTGWLPTLVPVHASGGALSSEPGAVAPTNPEGVGGPA